MKLRPLIAILTSIFLWHGCGDPTPENTVAPCEDHSDYLFCRDNDAECGDFTATDACGQVRTVDCGQCDSTCLENNRCECIPEEDQTFCERNLQQCAYYTGLDNCDQPRSVDCGLCPEGELCIQNLSAKICRADNCNSSNCRDGTCVNGKCMRGSVHNCLPGQSWNGSSCGVSKPSDRP